MQNNFLRSLDSLTPDDIAPPSSPQKRTTKKGDIVAYLLLVAFSAVFIFCAVQLVLYFREDAVAQEKYKEKEVVNIDQALQNDSNTGNSVWQRPTDPNGTTSQPVIIIPPSIGTTEPTGTTTEPIGTTTEPIGTTTEPTGTTAEPVGTTTEPVDTTTEPVDTTTEPVDTTTEPVDTTTEPVDTTTEPVGTTTEPIVTTTEPIVTTTEPIVTTTEPIVTTTEPVVTTTEPVVTTTEPVITTTETPQPPVTEPDDGYSDKFRELRTLLDRLVALNPDIYGYISIPVLDISYPLLYSPDIENAYYLTHTYDNDDNRAGSVFTDRRCGTKLTSCLNTVVYGHNMRNKTMFGKLPSLLSDEALFNSAEIIIVTYEGIFTYELFSAYRTTSSYNYCQVYFPTTDALVEFCNKAQSQSSFNKNMTFYNSDRILTLSTCTNLTVSGRYAFHAVLVRIET